MKKLSLFIFILPFFCNAQFLENFDDGDFTNPAMWTGNTLDFEVNFYNQLQLNAQDATSEKYLSTSVATNGATTWRFKHFTNTLNPSSSNNASIYLVSNNQNLLESLNGYFIKMGGSSGATDAIEFYRQTGTNTTLLASGTLGLAAESLQFEVEVIRDSNYNWQINVDTTLTGNFNTEINVQDNTHQFGNYIGVVCDFTSSFSNRFAFDDFFVDPVFVDNIAPEIISVNVVSQNQLDLTFSEPVNISTAENPNNYVVNPGVGIATMAIVDLQNPTLVSIWFNNNFPANVQAELSVGNVQDLNGNTILQNTQYQFVYTEFEYGSVIITEIMADPEPQVALPSTEYIELYNNTAFNIELLNWEISDATSSVSLPSFTLESNSYLIVCDNDDVVQFQSFGNVLGVNALPSLNNSSDLLTVKSTTGIETFVVEYNDSWYKNPEKESGGFSLEMIDITTFESSCSNWAASENVLGGSPGQANSTYFSFADVQAPTIENVQILNTNAINIFLSESIDESSFNASNFTFDPNFTLANEPTIVSGNTIAVSFIENIDSNVVYTLSLNGIKDCSANLIEENEVVEFFNLSKPKLGDVLINEILFNPSTGGARYIEFINIGENFVNLADLVLARKDTLTNLFNDIEEVSFSNFLLRPKEIVAVTENTLTTKLNYNPPENANIYQINNLPSFYNDKGYINLLRTGLDSLVLDEVNYFEDWHHPLISDKNGVALERLSTAQPSSDRNNWASASSLVNFGTPGYTNSQQLSENISENQLAIAPKVFSPDGDGYEDFLTISFNLDAADWIANIQIFDQQGRFVKTIANNQLIANDAILRWDGETENNERSPIGIYVLYAELFNPNGAVEVYKQSFAIATRF